MRNQSANSRVVVTGVGLCLPLGNTWEACRKELREAGPDFIKSHTVDSLGNEPVGLIPEAWLEDPGQPEIIFKIEHTTKMTLNVVRQCLAQAQWQETYAEETGIASGSFFGTFNANTDFVKVLTLEGPKSLDPECFPPASHNYPVSIAAIRHHLHGPVISLINTLIAGTQALLQAAQMIRAGRTSRMLVLGFEEINAVNLALMKNNPELFRPTRGSESPDRYFMEGCGGLLLETEESARARGAEIIAQILDWEYGFMPKAAAGTALADKIEPMLRRRGINSGEMTWRCPTAMKTKLIPRWPGKIIPGSERIGNYLGAAGIIETALNLGEWEIGQTAQPHLLVDGDAFGNYAAMLFAPAEK